MQPEHGVPFDIFWNESYSEAYVTLCGISDPSNAVSAIFLGLSNNNLAFDFELQTDGEDNKPNVSFVTWESDLPAVEQLLSRLKSEKKISYDEIIAESGTTTLRVEGYWTYKMMDVICAVTSSLGNAGINIRAMTNSNHDVKMVIDVNDAKRALQTLEKSFELDQVS